MYKGRQSKLGGGLGVIFDLKAIVVTEASHSK
jgi:hypothetical protein